MQVLFHLDNHLHHHHLLLIIIIISQNAPRSIRRGGLKGVHHWHDHYHGTISIWWMIITVTSVTLVQPLPTFFFSIFSFFLSFGVLLNTFKGVSISLQVGAHCGLLWLLRFMDNLGPVTYMNMILYLESIWVNFWFYCKERGQFFSSLHIKRAKRKLKKMCELRFY